MPDHIKRRDLPRTAWTQALAYAATSRRKTGQLKFSNPRLWAALAWLGSLLSQWLMGHRNIYETTNRKGIVILYWHPPWGMMTRGMLSALLFSTALVFLPSWKPVIVIALATLLASLLVMRSFTGRLSKAHEGTQKLSIPSQRLAFGTIATHPDTEGIETPRLALRLLNSYEDGTMVVAHPRTDELRRQYAKAGFKPSKGAAMFYEVGTHRRSDSRST